MLDKSLKLSRTAIKYVSGFAIVAVAGGTREVESGPAVSLWLAADLGPVETFAMEFVQTASGGAFGGYASIQQLQIGVTIEVTPLINPDGLVVMDIHVKIDSFEGNVTIQNVGDVPVTSSKDANAKVAVRDRDTIMLGGLIQTQKTDNNSGVPLLKDIPLLGFLFRTSSYDNSRQELIVR